MRRILVFALILVGFTSVVSQTLLIREFLISFYGNELSVGVILASWLFWVTVGSWGLGRLADRLSGKVDLFICTQTLIWLILPLEIILVRLSKNFIGVGLGEIVGFLPMLYSSFIILAPFCILHGLQFALGCRIFAMKFEEAPRQIGQVYIYDSLGDLTGGLIFSFLLVYYLHPFQIVLVVCDLNLLAGLLLVASSYGTSRSAFSPPHPPQGGETSPLAGVHGSAHILKKFFIGLIIVLLVSSIYMLSSSKITELQTMSCQWRWKGHNLIEEANSIYGNLVATKRGDQYSFYENGLINFTTSDKVFNEYIIHMSMLEHPSPKRILLIGGGASGALTEILKHNPQRIDYVELDPLIIKMARKYIPEIDRKALANPEVKIHHLDGRLFVKRAKSTYDMVLVNLPNPYTAQLNRFYTLEFFREVKDVLTQNGILALAISSNEYYLGKELRNFNASLFWTLKEAFADIVAIPGEDLLLLGSPSEGVLTYDSRILNERFTRRKIQTQFLTSYHISYQLAPRRISFLLGCLDETKAIRKNYDFHPISYQYDMVLWSTYFYPHFRNFFSMASGIRLWHFGAALAGIVLGLLAMAKRFHRIKTKFTPLAIATTGFAGMTFQVVLVLAFQILYGYVYRQIGIIIAFFMMGLAGGALTMNYALPGIRRNISTLRNIEGAIILYALALPVGLTGLSYIRGVWLFWLAQIIFPILVALAGFLVGLEFPLANRIYLTSFEKVGKTAGMLYGMDLVGGLVGALLASALLIPILGIFQTCVVVALFNLATFILLFCSPQTSGR